MKGYTPRTDLTNVSSAQRHLTPVETTKGMKGLTQEKDHSNACSAQKHFSNTLTRQDMREFTQEKGHTNASSAKRHLPKEVMKKLTHWKNHKNVCIVKSNFLTLQER